MSTIQIERFGSLVFARATAPDGYVWASSFVHELVASSRGKWALADARGDVAERMKMGLEKCTDQDCCAGE